MYVRGNELFIFYILYTNLVLSAETTKAICQSFLAQAHWRHERFRCSNSSFSKHAHFASRWLNMQTPQRQNIANKLSLTAARESISALWWPFRSLSFWFMSWRCAFRGSTIGSTPVIARHCGRQLLWPGSQIERGQSGCVRCSLCTRNMAMKTGS